MITQAEIKRFADAAQCPKCGAEDVKGDSTVQFASLPFLPDMNGILVSADAPVPAPASPRPKDSIVVMRLIRVRYCAGGKSLDDPAPVTDPMAQLTDVFKTAISVHSQIGQEPASHSSINICAGVTEEHLHKTCSVCNYEWLMQCKDAKVCTCPEGDPVHTKADCPANIGAVMEHQRRTGGGQQKEHSPEAKAEFNRRMDEVRKKVAEDEGR